jgi:hypothetical protein
MKIRIKGNTIRIRLVQAEVKTLGIGETILERTEFGNGLSLSYALAPSAVHTELAAEFKENTISVFVPEAIAHGWFSNDVISLMHTVENGTPGGLKILVEKDFVCLDHTDEDQSDNYPNPNRGKPC